MDDFYEDDEPVKDVRAAYERSEKGVTLDSIVDGIITDDAELLRRLGDG